MHEEERGDPEDLRRALVALTEPTPGMVEAENERVSAMLASRPHDLISGMTALGRRSTPANLSGSINPCPLANSAISLALLMTSMYSKSIA